MRLSCAGKAFILGEYAVLSGRPALVAAVPPRFSVEVSVPFGSRVRQFLHPESPAGRLLAQNPDLALEFEDPMRGRGGMGGSSAEFVLAYLALASRQGRTPGWRDLYSRYREITHGDAGIPPSGADVVVQTHGGIVSFEPRRIELEDLSGSAVWEQLLVFSATVQEGRKVATHRHLEALDAARVEEIGRRLEPVIERGLEGARRGDPRSLGKALVEQAETLGSLGLEIEAAKEDRLALSGLPGVAGAKGAGALLADAFVVLMEPEATALERADLIEAAEARGLQLLCDGLAPELPAGMVR